MTKASLYSSVREQEWQAELRKALADVDKYRDQASTQFERANAATDACTALSQDNARLAERIRALEPVVEAAIDCIKAEQGAREWLDSPRILSSRLKQKQTEHLRALRETSEVLRIAVDAYEQSLLTSKEGIG